MVEQHILARNYFVVSRIFWMLSVVILFSACHVRWAADHMVIVEAEAEVPAQPGTGVEPAVSAPLPGAYDIDRIKKLLEGKRVGLVVNHTSLVGDKHLIDTLLALNIQIERIFAPEHGFKGNYEAGDTVRNTALEGRKKLNVISLYGTRKQPSKEDLDSLDVLVFDIQDVGVRFYTYISTLHYVMESSAEFGKPLIIFDRPNPNGHYIDGFVLEKPFRSFVGMHPIPVVHGLTMGELASMINGEGWLSEGRKLDLTVVKNLHYTHLSNYETPVPPSPNLRDILAILLYPSTCFFEGTVITEGRGTDRPFVQFGHPVLTGSPHQFTPVPSKGFTPRYADTLCYGFDLSCLSTDAVRAKDRIDLSWLLKMYGLYPDKEKFFLPSLYIDKLAGTDRLRKMILEGKSEEDIRNNWKQEIEAYKKIRKKYLLYADFE